MLVWLGSFRFCQSPARRIELPAIAAVIALRGIGFPIVVAAGALIVSGAGDGAQIAALGVSLISRVAVAGCIGLITRRAGAGSCGAARGGRRSSGAPRCLRVATAIAGGRCRMAQRYKATEGCRR